MSKITAGDSAAHSSAAATCSSSAAGLRAPPSISTVSTSRACTGRNEWPRGRRRLSTRYGQNRHYLHGFAWEDCEVRMIFEELRGGFVRVCANDRVGSQLIADVFDTAASDL